MATPADSVFLGWIVLQRPFFLLTYSRHYGFTQLKDLLWSPRKQKSVKLFCFPGTFLAYSKECSRPSIGHLGASEGSKNLSTRGSEQRQSCALVAWTVCFVLQPVLCAKSCHAWVQPLPSAGCVWPIYWSGDHWSPIKKIGQSRYSREKARNVAQVVCVCLCLETSLWDGLRGQSNGTRQGSRLSS